MPGSAGLVGVGESVMAGLADGVASTGVLVVEGDVPDSFVEPHRVVLDRWLKWARRCRIPSFVKLAKAITKHRAGIEATLTLRTIQRTRKVH